ncbi:hypothetical protein FA146_22880 [Pseudomonas aeruginosa]|nr:hypothetical protein [Pseudomonas aeruginosa]
MTDIFLIERMLENEFVNSNNHAKAAALIRALDSSQKDLSSQYSFLQSVVKSDTGNAGGECERVFSDFLKKYLPKDIEIIVGGVIILENGEYSPQIDLIITQDLPELLSKSYVPHEYVIAAFEVKLTLEKRYLKKIADTAFKLRPFSREGTPREVLFGRIIYGVLALSSNLSGPKLRTDQKTLESNEKECQALIKAIKNFEPPEHPSQAIDLFLVADSFFLGSTKTINYSEKFPNEFEDITLNYTYNLSRGTDFSTASNLARIISAPPRDQTLGAFLYHFFLMLHREDVISSRSPEAFSLFESSISQGCHSWSMDSLGSDFKREWNARIEDQSFEWQSTHI